MSFSITETDIWPRVARAVVEERARCMQGLLHVRSLEDMRRQQGFIEALDWVLDEARPAPQPRTTKDEDE